MFLIIGEVKETILIFHKELLGYCELSFYDLATACSRILFCFNIIPIQNESI